MYKLSLLSLIAVSAPLAAQDLADADAARERLEAAIVAADKARKEADEARAEAVKALDMLNAARTASLPRDRTQNSNAPTSATYTEAQQEVFRSCEQGKVEDNYNDFVKNCLGMKTRQDFETANVAITYGGTSANDAVELEANYVLRYRKIGGLLGEGASYLKLIGGAFAAEQKDAENAFFDFDEIQNGSGFKLGFEYGVFNSSKKDRAAALDKGMAKAKQDCVVFHAINTGNRPDAPIYQPNTAVEQCSGNNLWAWVAGDGKRQNLYWKETVGKLYGVDNDQPNFVLGFNYRQAYQDFNWLSDQQLTAINDQTTFEGLSDGASKDSTKPFSIKAYLGASLSSFGEAGEKDGRLEKYGKKIGLGLVSSIAYKNEYDFDDKEAICLPQGAFSRCQNFNLSAPEKVTNWVPGVSLNAKFPRFWVIPDFGVSIKATYQSHTNQFGIQAPVYFTVSDSKLSGGFKIYYLEDGVTPDGGIRQGDSGIAFFVGTNFSLLDGR